MRKLFLLPLFLILASCCFSQHTLEKLWETDSLFKVPESVLYDAKNSRLYVTNIDGEPWGADGKGSVGLLGIDGTISNAEWVTGLNAPKGMGLYQDKLYVADLGNIVVIDIKEGSIVGNIPVSGASGLNDLTIDENGVIYVSDSKLKKIFKVGDGKTTIYIDNLKGPNGVHFAQGKLYYLDAGALFVQSGNQTVSKIAEGMEGGTDAVEPINKNDFVVSCWAGAIWYVSGNGNKELLLDAKKEKINTADLGIDPVNNIVFVPTFWRNTVMAFKVK